MASKVDFANQVQRAATDLMSAAENMAALIGVYYDRGYNAGGGSEITDPDIAETDLTATDLASTITAGEQLANYLDSQPVVVGDYGSSYNKARNIANL